LLGERQCDQLRSVHGRQAHQIVSAHGDAKTSQHTPSTSVAARISESDQRNAVPLVERDGERDVTRASAAVN
jgi:hypothetical protein